AGVLPGEAAVVEDLGDVGQSRPDAGADAAVAPQPDHGLDRVAELLRIDLGAVTADHASILQALHPFRGGGRGEPHLATELRIARARILLEKLEKLPVL